MRSLRLRVLIIGNLDMTYEYLFMLLCRSLWFTTHSSPLINRICNSLWLPIWRFRSLHSEHICPTVACSDSLLWAKECFLWINSRRRFAIPSSLLRDRMTRSLVDYPTTAVDAFSSRWRCCSHMCSPPDFPKDTRPLGHAYTSKADRTFILFKAQPTKKW